MKKIITMVCLFFFAAPLLADGMRCGNALVSTGDSKYIVLQKCGQPISTETVAYKKVRKMGEQVEGYVEELIYPLTSSSYNVLTFENGKLIKVTFHREQ